MTTFNADINVTGIAVNPPEDENSSSFRVQLTLGQVLPFDQGDGVPLVVPFGTLSFGIDKKASLATAQLLEEYGQQLKETSRIALAQNISGIETAAQKLAGLKTNANS